MSSVSLNKADRDEVERLRKELTRLAQAQGIHAVVSKQQAVSELVSQAQSLLGLLDREGDSDKFRNAS